MNSSMFAGASHTDPAPNAHRGPAAPSNPVQALCQVVRIQRMPKFPSQGGGGGGGGGKIPEALAEGRSLDVGTDLVVGLPSASARPITDKRPLMLGPAPILTSS